MGNTAADIPAVPDGTAVRIHKTPDGSMTVSFDPALCIDNPATVLRDIDAAIGSAAAGSTLRFECDCQGSPDSILVGLILESMRKIQRAKLETDLSGLPESIRKLVALGMAVAPHRPPEIKRDYFVLSIGRKTFAVAVDSFHFVQFIGELTYSFYRFLLGRARFRSRDFWVTLQQCGVDALPIVGLLSVLTGIILAFIGAVQLQKFGATGVIMSGRT